MEIEVAEVLRLLESEANLIDYEDEVYDAAIRWLNWDLENRQEFAIRLCITFESQKNDYALAANTSHQ